MNVYLFITFSGLNKSIHMIYHKSSQFNDNMRIKLKGLEIIQSSIKKINLYGGILLWEVKY